MTFSQEGGGMVPDLGGQVRKGIGLKGDIFSLLTFSKSNRV